ncbi:hypothetical protein [Sphingomonas panacis]|nr:hypothetical protein [Sphingomonas panacis]
MIIWSPSTGHFYHTEIHGEDVPADGVSITSHRHRTLLDGQRSGRQIAAGADGKPTLTPAIRVTTATLRQHAGMDIRVEARRRILAVASIERQSNDNALFGLYANKLIDKQAFDEALARRLRIDAIRAASNTLEAKIATWAAAALGKLDVTDPAHWPAEA